MKLVSFITCIFFSVTLMAQKSESLEDLLWEEAGGRIAISEDNGGEYEIIDDAKNGYLKVAFTEHGCGCYYETTLGAYKNADGKYATLKMNWDGCGWRKTLSSNKELKTILPKKFGIHTFLPKSKETEYQILPAVFYLEANIPIEGTDTRLDLTYIPFGINITPEDHILSYEYKQMTEHGGSNFLYSGDLKAMIRKISEENTLECILDKSLDDIVPKDRKIVEDLYGEGKRYRNIELLALRFRELKTIYEISKDMEYKSVILGWDREKARFFVKEKIENDIPDLSFLEFLKQLPFLEAIC